MAYSAEDWALIEALYQSGKFKSIPALHEKCTKILQRCPSLDAMKKRFGKKALDKHKLEPVIEKALHDRLIDEFARQGMPQEKVIALTIEGIRAGEQLAVDVYNKMLEDGGAPGEETINILKAYATDLGTRHKYIQEYFKLCGLYAAQKREVTGRDGGPIKTQADMTDAEAKEKLVDLLKASPDLKQELASLCG